jgi:hypothetical protein
VILGLFLTVPAFSVFSWVFLSLFPMLVLRDVSRGQPTWPFYATSILSFV